MTSFIALSPSGYTLKSERITVFPKYAVGTIVLESPFTAKQEDDILQITNTQGEYHFKVEEDGLTLISYEKTH